ncbi:MAG: Plug domain-containing protein [Acidobacteria bacterium]|nr:Plug domain-containing protein [Acidobacteriota bacterium]
MIVPGGDSGVLEVSVVLIPLNETMTVTASQLPTTLTVSISDVKLVTAETLREMPYQALDDALHSFPEFPLLRRASSLEARPTTQGISLRGIGPSGVSRSLVLADVVPLNDAFGGRIYWDRIPMLSLQQVDVARGDKSPILLVPALFLYNCGNGFAAFIRGKVESSRICWEATRFA